MYTYTTIREIVDKLNLEILNEGNLDLKIDIPNIYQIGYELVGFLDKESDELNKYINVCSLKESRFIATFSKDRKEKVISEYMSLNFPALIFSKDAIIADEFYYYAKKYNKNILLSNEKASVTVRKIKFFLSKALSVEEEYENYSLMEIHGVGVLMTGYSNARKGVMIELLERGHRMITDKNLIIKRVGENDLVGYNAKKREKLGHFYLEDIKGGYVDVTDHFGVKSTRVEKKINIFIVLEEWNEKEFYDRLGLDVQYQDFVGEKIQKYTIPVRKGRNLAVIIETAALTFRLRRMGHNTPLEFLTKSQEIIERKKKEREEYMNTNRLPVTKLINEFDLEIKYGEDKVPTTYIKSSNVYRPSLSLIGFFDLIEEVTNIGIQIFSKMEFKFLEKLCPSDRVSNLKKFLSYDIPMIVLTVDADPPDYFFDLVKESGKILAIAPYKKSSQIIANFNNYLDSFFSETVSVHGVLVEIFGFGVLLTGKSGIGKSETALELIHRGHRLIADDMVKFYRDTQGDVVGKSAELPFFMEIRGLGIIDIKTLYGLSAVRLSKSLDMIIELQAVDNSDYMSAPSTHLYEDVLGKPIKKRILEISSGRNAAAMVEVMVMDHMSGLLGQK
ncbi:HPr(Ser) kinase/phosphatase [Fusobacterium hwasookii]|uniref:Serine kinase n=1 Tax=Fusobacterium hwasookii ChDC F174 TaxID=1307442 RepID=A0A0S2ZNV8_9FUSO|nr:HPr(Ser) kinase/phosphatase [Fusobacterium hwasookii]ALQ37409.1 serine kinase [Fusobacterium hwasookii ChDC F300]ALQ40473.1 serine kinase [Fusobacterium hwasookii ChDC F174]QNE67639.1 HPr(Ser) kinase/phosphatase [Fusobacterium hwasookii]QYR55034.1 HPr(Ser) kinase/phosphatase [Fusobacterium hwasookii]